MVKSKNRLFLLPEEPPVNEHGLVIPLAPSGCIFENKDSHTAVCKPDRHHLYWEASLYKTQTFSGLIASGLFVVNICRHVHDELHNFQQPPLKPSPKIARLAIKQAQLEALITAKYQNIDAKTEKLESGTLKQPKRVEKDIEKLYDQIDELKEQRGLLVQKGDAVLPTQQYRVVFLGEDGDLDIEIPLEDIPGC